MCVYSFGKDKPLYSLALLSAARPVMLEHCPSTVALLVLSTRFLPSESKAPLMFPCNYLTSSCWHSGRLIAKRKLFSDFNLCLMRKSHTHKVFCRYCVLLLDLLFYNDWLIVMAYYHPEVHVSNKFNI